MTVDPATGPARPEVIVNCAVSADGRLAYAHGKRARLSGPEDLKRVQALRARSDAILVGVGTVLRDDPSLRVHWELLAGPKGTDPLRVVLDTRGRTPPTARVLDTRQPTLIAVASSCEREFPRHIAVFRSPGDSVELPALLAELQRRRVRRLLVEGGSRVIASFLRSGLVAEMTVFVAPMLIGGSTAPSMMAGPETEDERGTVRLALTGADRVDDGLVLTYVPRDPGASSVGEGAQSRQ